MALRRSVRRRLFSIDPQDTLASKRGFDVPDDVAKERLQTIGATFVAGYHAAIDDDDPSRLCDRLAEHPNEQAGWAFEGAAMALALRDFITPWNRRRFVRFLSAGGAPHTYLMHVGAGWVAARLHRDPVRFGRHLDPLLRWLAVDGYGFHEGYFRWRQIVDKRAKNKPYAPRLRGYGGHAYHQGLGRSLWFVEGTDLQRIVARIEEFPAQYHGDLWSGLGLAAAYAGNGAEVDWQRLRVASGDHAAAVAQGVCFAAKARERAGNPSPCTATAAQAMWALSAAACAAESDVQERATADCDESLDQPRYALWRQRIQESWLQRQEAVEVPR